MVPIIVLSTILEQDDVSIPKPEQFLSPQIDFVIFGCIRRQRFASHNMNPVCGACKIRNRHEDSIIVRIQISPLTSCNSVPSRIPMCAGNSAGIHFRSSAVHCSRIRLLLPVVYLQRGACGHQMKTTQKICRIRAYRMCQMEIVFKSFISLLCDGSSFKN